MSSLQGSLFEIVPDSHDLALIRYVCERTLVMYLGQVVEEANIHVHVSALRKVLGPEVKQAGSPFRGCPAATAPAPDPRSLRGRRSRAPPRARH